MNSTWPVESQQPTHFLPSARARLQTAKPTMTQQTEAVEMPAEAVEVTDVVQVPAATTGEADEMDGELRLTLTENASRACGPVGGPTHSDSAALLLTRHTAA